ncbi:hepatocellular carcinoma-associated antigen 59-domain-containing protein [Paecilomyces variotii]|uniref:Hepatocellular carcinoma-associated antigen 59-domain-containing protein n=1 Tax=Byssochlamys spectabilis TaxID=264951 RepID=A0A443HHN3_BYSSP|nr:hepatocellular carcinoma-associated antigen 59-domain-containing protein [Paecilomyces variotii]KAJ9305653.1 hypothetical protein DTO217A2_4882 [Paecilomyces variotii]KAJ9357268.1 hypothetical protein DTO280E4_5671 [Paecilomyces variotii]KAJ9369981.1 hypothetical protein DTO282E5_5321 [Paecilomyces variotii]RWQ91331.1 hepatocellular carcinoma-associated antigen 59-domain-containing protein [Paecilomyces variotii]
MTDLAETAGPLFRPVKKRKFLRKRPEDDLNTEPENAPSAPPSQAEQQQKTQGLSTASTFNDDEESTPVSDILRLRKVHKARRGGVEFSASSRSRTHGDAESTDLVNTQDQDVEKVRAMADRFTAHTGQKVDVDKHMMAYIESELAKRHQRDMPTEDISQDSRPANETVDRQSDPRFLQREPASLGKLHEIDLGDEAKLENIARTEAATRRLVGEAPPSPTEEAPQKKARDGKSWRNRKRRTSEDIERDRLVEEVLRESRLDVYEEPEEQGEPDDQAADDRIAEQFRRDFLDALQSRRRGTRTKPTKTAKQEPPKGPKLGGSRSARAAMRELQEKGQK